MGWVALEESHEQKNACVKGDGCAVCLTENSSALPLRWMVSGPEMAGIIGEFRSVLDRKQTSSVRGPAKGLILILVHLVFFFTVFIVFNTHSFSYHRRFLMIRKLE